MSRGVRAFVLAAVAGSLAAACAPAEVLTADPEAAQLDPPVIIIDEPEPEPEPAAEPGATAGISPAVLVADPQTEVITFVGADAPPGMAEEVTGSPKRDPLPSMMSEVLTGPNK